MKSPELPVKEFIRRFLLHVLPKEYRRIRMFGFLSNRYKRQNLEQIRELLELEPVVEKGERPSVAEMILKSTGINILLCPK